MRHSLLLTGLAMALAVTLNPSAAHGRQLSAAQALERARQSASGIQLMSAHHAEQLQLAYTATAIDNTPSVYVFNSGNDGGFMLVPANDSGTRPVLGYSDSGRFDVNNMPDNVRWWLSQYTAEIMCASQRGREHELGQPRTSETRPTIDPIVKTLWNQLAPYNLLCPVVNGTRCPTGCVATAMAQVMSVYRYPSVGTGHNAYTPSTVGHQLSVNFAETHYDWDNITDTYSSKSTAVQDTAIATLMYSLGVSIDMMYTPNSSGGNYEIASRALVNNFGYDQGLHCLERDYYGLLEWIDMVYRELAEGRPVLYGGTNSEDGHAFVVDGYSADDFFHLNWGWGGMSNGYFQLTALNPTEQGTGGSAGGYNIGQMAVFGVKPAEEGSTIYPVLEFTSDFRPGASSYTRASGTNVMFYDPRGIFNESVAKFIAEFGVKLVDEQGTVTYIPATATKSLIPGQGFRSYYVASTSFPTSGTYEVTPVVRNTAGDQWVEAGVKLSNIRSLTLTATPQTLSFSADPDASISVSDYLLNSPIYPGLTYDITATVTNATDEEYLGEVTPVLVQNGSEMAQGDPMEVDLLPETSDRFEWQGNFPSSLATGDYSLYLVDENGQALTIGTPVSVAAAPTGEPSISVDYFGLTTAARSGAGTTKTDPAEVDLSHVEVVIALSCTQGYFGYTVNTSVADSHGQRVDLFEGPFVALSPGDSRTVTMTKDLSALDPTGVYRLTPRLADTEALSSPIYIRQYTPSAVATVGTDYDAEGIFVDVATNRATAYAAQYVSAVTVYSVQGVQMASTRADVPSERLSVDVATLSPGVYVAVVTTANGQSKSLKMIKR